MLLVKADAATIRAGEERLAEFGARAEINGSTGEWRADTILAAGRHGLEYFRLFDPPHARLTGRRHDFRHDFLRRSDHGADVVFGSLRQDRERFDAVAAGLSDHVIALRNAGASVFGSWQGGAADGTRAGLDELLAEVDAVRGRFTGLAAAIGDTVDAIDNACYDKAVATSRLYDDRVHGRTSDDVRFLVGFVHRARGNDVDHDDVADAAALSGWTPGPSGWRTWHAHVAEVATAAETWLQDVVSREHERKLAEFDRICATARDRLAAAWQALAAAFEDAGEPAPPSPPIAWRATESTPAPPAAAVPAGGGYLTGGSAGGTGSATGSGAAVPPDHRPSPGVSVGAVPAVGDGEPRRPGTTQAGGAAAAGMPGAGMFGAPAVASGQGGEDQQRRVLDLPLTGDLFAEPAPAPAAVVGDEHDPATYNEAGEEAAVVARDEVRRAEAATPRVDDDDLW